MTTPRISPPFNGMALRYLIGTDQPTYSDGSVTEVAYDVNKCRTPLDIAYCNLFDENNTGKYKPYLHDSDTAKDYNEGQIDPKGAGWNKNLMEQYERRKRAGFKYIELDNPDAYHLDSVFKAIDLAAQYNLRVIAKNPNLCKGNIDKYLQMTDACIVESGAGGSDVMDILRKRAGKPDMMVWFVMYGVKRTLANAIARNIKQQHYKNMGVTYSPRGEYASVVDIIRPEGV